MKLPRVHLLTAVLIQIELAAVVGLNAVSYVRNDLANANEPGPRWHVYGRPFMVYAIAFQCSGEMGGHDPEYTRWDYFECSREVYFVPMAMGFNLALAAGLVSVTYMLCERKLSPACRTVWIRH